MEKDRRKGQGETLSNVIRIADERVSDHLGKIVLGSVEETLNALLSPPTVTAAENQQWPTSSTGC